MVIWSPSSLGYTLSMDLDIIAGFHVLIKILISISLSAVSVFPTDQGPMCGAGVGGGGLGRAGGAARRRGGVSARV